jgi:hypothetical protein
MTMSNTSRLPLRDGPTVPAEVVLWMLDAADRGLTFTLLPSGRFTVTPRQERGSENDQYLRAHRNDVAAMLAYVERIAAAPVEAIGSPWQVPPAAAAAPTPEPAEPAHREPVEVPLWP